MSREQFNKLIATVDRHFTWDKREMNINEYSAFDYERNAYVHVKRTPYGIWCFISTNNVKFGEFINTFHELHELNNFIKMVKLIG